MSNLILKFVFDRRKRSSKTKEGSVELRITLHKGQKYIATGVRCLPKYWKGCVVGLSDANELNTTLENLKKRVRKIANNLEDEGELSLGNIIRKLKDGENNKDVMFLDYVRDRSEVRSLSLAHGTQKRYKVFYEFLKEWGKAGSVSQITPKLIIQMDNELRKRGLKECSRWNYHKFMKMYINDAIQEGLIRSNPYNEVKIKRGSCNGLDRCLTESEFRKLQKTDPNSVSLEKVRDLFVFQTYTMMSYCDLKAFDYRKCREVDGLKVYTSKRLKTGQPFTIALMDGALEILAKYNNHLPIISDQKYNLYLKALALQAGIGKEITSHYARHTGATLLLNKGVRLEVISKVLGHSNTKITENVYAKMMEETIAKQMAAIKI